MMKKRKKTNKGKSPGKAHRITISVMQLADMFPDEASAVTWFESIYWPNERVCGHCGSTKTRTTTPKQPMPYRCQDCKKYFSVRTGTAMQSSRLPLRKWAFAIYLYVTSLKSVSSMKLHRDIKVTQKTAWFMLHRLRQAWDEAGSLPPFSGPVEADETYVGGKEHNKPLSKRRRKGRGTVGKAAVVGVKDRKTNKVRARHVERTDAATLQGFVDENTQLGAKVYTDNSRAYVTLRKRYQHEAVNHGVLEYVRGQAHTNGIESFWSMFKRAHKGTFHKMSKKHLHRYVAEFAERHNLREFDTIELMRDVAARMIGKRLMYADLISD